MESGSAVARQIASMLDETYEFLKNFLRTAKIHYTNGINKRKKNCSSYIRFYIHSEPELQILDYVTQQELIFTAIAGCFAMKFNARRLWDMFNVINAQLHEGNFERLGEVQYFIKNDLLSF